MARVYTARERRLIKEFMAIYAPGITPIYNARLGPYPQSFAEKVTSLGTLQQVSPSQRYADAALIYSDHVELWEGKIELDGQAIGQLLVYREAWAETPEVESAAHLPVSLHIVAGYADPISVTVAKQQGIDVHLYTPEWLQEQVSNWPSTTSKPLVGAAATLSQQGPIKL